MQTALAKPAHTIEEQFTMAKINTASDLRKLIASYDVSLNSPMLDVADKKALMKLRDELQQQLNELEA